jgi:hypothetical protein
VGVPVGDHPLLKLKTGRPKRARTNGHPHHWLAENHWRENKNNNKQQHQQQPTSLSTLGRRTMTFDPKKLNLFGDDCWQQQTAVSSLGRLERLRFYLTSPTDTLFRNENSVGHGATAKPQDPMKRQQDRHSLQSLPRRKQEDDFEFSE